MTTEIQLSHYRCKIAVSNIKMENSYLKLVFDQSGEYKRLKILLPTTTKLLTVVYYALVLSFVEAPPCVIISVVQ